MSRRAWISAATGVPILLTDVLEDGEVFFTHTTGLEFGGVPPAGTTILLGTRRRTAVEEARYRGKWLAQQGLIDWLLYIGEKPIPKHQRTHQDVLRALRAHP